MAMESRDPLVSGLDAFAEQFQAQADSTGLPASEHAVHFCIALGLQAAWALAPGDIVFERPVARTEPGSINPSADGRAGGIDRAVVSGQAR